MALSVDIFYLRPQRKQDGDPLGMIPADLHVQQVLSVLHGLRRQGVEIRDIVQILDIAHIAYSEKPSVGFYELIPDRIERNGEL